MLRLLIWYCIQPDKNFTWLVRTQQNVDKTDWKVVMNRDDKLLQFSEQVLQDVKPQNSVILCAITGIYRETVNNKIKFIQKCSSVSLFKLKTNLTQFFCLLPQLNQITSSPFGLLSSVFIFETSEHCSLQEVKYLTDGSKNGLSSYNCFNYQNKIWSESLWRIWTPAKVEFTATFPSKLDLEKSLQCYAMQYTKPRG